MSKARRVATAPVTVAAVVGLILAAMTLGGRVPVAGVLDPLPRLRALDVSPDSIGVVAPLRTDYLASLLRGSGLEDLLAKTGGHAPFIGGGSPATPESGDGDRHSFPLPPVVPAHLDIRMAADRSKVHPSEDIWYTITITNTGDKPFRGDLSSDSHHPFGTTDDTPASCGDLDPSPGDPCVTVAVPVPGTPDQSVHTVHYGISYSGGSRDSLAPDRSVVFRFRVRVSPYVEPGAEIVNHAHLSVVGNVAQSKTTKTVIVKVV